MTKEERDLLLKDLCARLPYKTYIEIINEDGNIYDEVELDLQHINTVRYDESISIKPYLRPMESMTSDEKMEWFQMRQKHCNMSGFNELQERADFTSESLDWLNKKGFDYRGLKGLALEAKPEMYKI